MSEPPTSLPDTRTESAVTDAADLGTVLGIWAHPDDETFLSGGLMAMAHEAGRRVVCVTVTLGERGTSDWRRWPPWGLAPVRTHEIRASLAALGVTEHHLLDIPDGTCAIQPRDPVVRRLVRMIDDVAPRHHRHVRPGRAHRACRSPSGVGMGHRGPRRGRVADPTAVRDHHRGVRRAVGTLPGRVRHLPRRRAAAAYPCVRAGGRAAPRSRSARPQDRGAARAGQPDHGTDRRAGRGTGDETGGRRRRSFVPTSWNPGREPGEPGRSPREQGKVLPRSCGDGS